MARKLNDKIQKQGERQAAADVKRVVKARSLSAHQSAQHINDLLHHLESSEEVDRDYVIEEISIIDLSYIEGNADGNVERAYQAAQDGEWGEAEEYLNDALEEYVEFYRDIYHTVSNALKEAMEDHERLRDAFDDDDFVLAKNIAAGTVMRIRPIAGKFYILRRLYTNRVESELFGRFVSSAFPESQLDILAKRYTPDMETNIAEKLDGADKNFNMLMRKVINSIAPKGAHRF